VGAGAAFAGGADLVSRAGGARADRALAGRGAGVADRDDGAGAEVGAGGAAREGYGDVRRRMMALHETLLAGVLPCG